MNSQNLNAKGETEFERFKKQQAARENVKLQQILAEYAQHFRKAKAVGPKPKGRQKHITKYFCNYCKVCFVTSPGAMVLRAKAHRADDFIKIGEVTGAAGGQRLKRPEQHAFCHTSGRCFVGSDARVVDIVPPKTGMREQGVVACRICSDHTTPYSHDMSIKAKGIAIQKFRKHEDKCHKKAEKTN